MESQALNVIKQFAHKYQFEEALDMINDIPEDIEADDLKATIESILLSIHTDVKNDIMLNDDETYDRAKEEIREATNHLLIAIGAVKRCEDIENDAVAQVKTFLNTEKEIIKNYTSRKAKRSIGTMSGRMSKKINESYAKYEKYIIGGVVVVVISGVVLLAVLGHNNKNGNNEEPNKPKTTQEDESGSKSTNGAGNNGSTASDVKIITESDIKNAASIIYNSWNQITEVYTVDDIENVIKALYGLDSNLTLDEADEIVESILEMVTIPRVNNILVGTPYEVKTIDVANLLINNKEKLLNMQQILNVALNTNDLETTAAAALKEEVMAYKFHSLDGWDAASKLVWARLTSCINAIHGTLGEDFYIEYNGNLYSQKEILESNLLEEVAINAKNEISGKTI